MMPIVFSMKIMNFSKVTLLKVTQFLSLSKVSLLKFSENAQKVLGLMTNNDLEEDLKFSKVTLLKTTKVLYP